VKTSLRWFACVLALGACASDGCDRYYAGLEVYVPPGNAYRLRFPSPPWSIASNTGESVELRIDRDIVVAGDGEVPAKYLLAIDLLPSTNAAREITRLTEAAMAANDEIVLPRRDVVTETGDEGVEVFTRETSDERRLNHRYVAFDSAAGCVRMSWEADVSLDNPEVDALIQVFDVRNAEAAP
jgi:hypothetical protein